MKTTFQDFRTDCQPTGAPQGCLLSPLIFLIAIDWTVRTTESQQTGLQWTWLTQLKDLDYTDDLALVSYFFSKYQMICATIFIEVQNWTLE